MKELSTHIEINAPAARVWRILTDTEAHSEWNPFIASIDGQLEEGSRLTVRMTPPKGMAMTFRPTVTKVVCNDIHGGDLLEQGKARWRQAEVLEG